MSQGERNFVVKSPREATATIRRALNNLPSKYSAKITLEKDDAVEFSSSFPEYALLKIKILSPSSVIRERINGMEQEVSGELPESIQGLLSCPNKNCITTQLKEPTNPRFNVVSVNPPKIQCYYCGRYIDQAVLLAQLA